MPQQGSFSTWDVVATSPTRLSVFIGSPCRSKLHSRWRRWRIVHALHSFAPPYLASSFTCIADMTQRRRLRSASTEQLDVPTYRRSTVGGRAFPAAGAKVWNGLPRDVTSASSLFRNRLKTYLFRRCYETFRSHYLPSRTVVIAIVSLLFRPL